MVVPYSACRLSESPAHSHVLHGVFLFFPWPPESRERERDGDGEREGGRVGGREEGKEKAWPLVASDSCRGKIG